ncbi:putative diphthamide synthesis protein-domain-containing protein, partial [Jimgerdemannia flammicorona]
MEISLNSGLNPTEPGHEHIDYLEQRRRYFLVQKAKDADVIGIVVGTLGVASYMDIIDHLKRLIRGAGKKSYTFVMGKLNVAKMANFMEIDCYVLVACPENSLIDSKSAMHITTLTSTLCRAIILCQEFYRPIVTPFELEIAISKWVLLEILIPFLLIPNLLCNTAHHLLAAFRSKEWTGDYITDFQQLLPGVRKDEILYGDE